MLPHVPFRLRLSCASCQVSICHHVCILSKCQLVITCASCQVSTCHHMRCAARALQHSTCHTTQDVWCVSLASYIYVIYVVPYTLSVKRPCTHNAKCPVCTVCSDCFRAPPPTPTANRRASRGPPLYDRNLVHREVYLYTFLYLYTPPSTPMHLP